MWQIYGQDHIILQLDAALKADRLSHAYLLAGPPHVGKMALSIGIAQAVNCAAGGRPAYRQPDRAAQLSPQPGPTAGLFDAADTFPDTPSPSLMGGFEQESFGEIEPGRAESPPCGQCSQCQRIADGLHPDVRIVGVGDGDEDGPSRRDIRIEQIREIESFLNLTPYEGTCKVIIVDGAELMNTAAANALLKTLEEPPTNTMLLLLTANEDALLPTIRSRCSTLYLKPGAKSALENQLTADYGADRELAEHLARISRGCFGQAVSALRNEQILEQRNADLERLQEVCESGLDVRFDYAAELATRFSRDREATKDLLYLWLRWWRDLLLIKEGGDAYLHNSDRIAPLRLQAAYLTTGEVVAFIKRLNRTLESLDANANPRLTLETLMLGLPAL